MTTPKKAGAALTTPEEDAQNAPMDDASESTTTRRRDKWEDGELVTPDEAATLEARLTGDGEDEDAEEEPEWDGTPPPGIMPEGLEAFCDAVAAGFGADPVLPTAWIPAVLAGCIGQRVAVSLGNNWPAPIILWHAVIAPPGLKKTPIHKYLKAPLKRLRGERIAQHEATLAAYEGELVSWKANKPKERGPEPKPPAAPAMPLVSDTTLEALAMTLAATPACLWAPDELAGFFNALGEYKGGKGADRQRMLSLRCGAGLEIDRKRDGPLDVAATGLSVAGGIQPGVVLKVGASERDAADGMLPRFGWAFAKVLPYSGENPLIPPALTAWWDSLCLTLARLDGDRVLTLSPDARRIWHEYQSDPANDAATCAPPEAGFASKKGDTIGPLAGIFALVEDPAATVIRGETMAMALGYWDWMMRHNRRLLAMAAGTGTSDPEAEKVKKVLRDAGGDLPHDKLRDTLGWKSASLAKVLARMEHTKTITITVEPRRGDRPGGRPRRMVRLVGGAQ